MESLDVRTRDAFDRQLQTVLDGLPAQVHALLDRVPLCVDDRPSPGELRRMGMMDPDELCGLYTGIPLTERSIDDSGQPPDRVQIFRQGILALARDEHGRVDAAELRRQIRITILHELGHHHGLDEDELERLGY